MLPFAPSPLNRLGFVGLCAALYACPSDNQLTADGGSGDAGASDGAQGDGGQTDGGQTDGGPMDSGRDAGALPICGDGLLVAPETCDDGNDEAGDGCSATCGLEPASKCPVVGQPCEPTICNDGTREGSEACDDGNDLIGDGCTPFCEVEPNCSGGICSGGCGDGQLFPPEACDDGNVRDGDGCSSTCELEAGFECNTVNADPPAVLPLTIIYRDFRDQQNTNGHPDFERGGCGLQQGIVQATLDGEGKPRLATPTNSCVTTQANFAEWYRNGVHAFNIPDQLSMMRTGVAPNFTYVFDDTTFWPIDGRGWTTVGEPELEGNDSNDHNFHFTSEVRFWFRYDPAVEATLTFRGDDDVWVFINGNLAVDIGGIHVALEDSVTLNATTESALGLTAGGIYEGAVFQAERHVTGSNYRLELQNFFSGRTECVGACGNGEVTQGEQCDDGNRVAGDGCDENCNAELI